MSKKETTKVETQERTAILTQKETTLQEWGAVVEKKSSSSTYDPEMWFKVEEGENKFRVVSPYKKYRAHAFKKDPSNPKDWGKEVKCSAVFDWVENKATGKKMPVYQKGSCPCCDLELAESKEGKTSSKDRWVFQLYDFKTSRVKVLKCGWSIFKLIDTLSRDADYGKPSLYNITIKKDSFRKPVSFISKVGPRDICPLSASEQQVVDSQVNVAYVEKLGESKEPAQIYRTMSFIRPNLEATFLTYGIQRPAEVQGAPELPAGESPKAKPVGNAKVKVAEEEESTSSIDEDFPDVDTQ